MIFRTAFLGLLCAFACVLGESTWDYSDGDKGPSRWGTIATDCSGQKQSPINIDPTLAVSLSSLVDFTFHDYDSDALNMTLSNNGHSVVVNIHAGNPRISGGDLPETFHLAQFHFHWGSTNNRGSEHKIRNEEFPMELHLVHWAGSRDEIGIAVDKPQGLAVLGFFFEIDGNNHNENYNHIINNLTYVNETKQAIKIPTFSLLDLLPGNVVNGDHDYYRYQGSLTTPGCYESVVWTVFEDTIKISQAQMDAFRAVMYDGHSIANNYRPVQSLNTRVVTTSKLVERDVDIIVRDDASHLSAFSALTSLMVAIATALRV